MHERLWYSCANRNREAIFIKNLKNEANYQGQAGAQGDSPPKKYTGKENLHFVQKRFKGAFEVCALFISAR